MAGTEPEQSCQQAGGAFYDRPGVVDRYRAHRADGVFSPNLVMEEPAVLDRLGDVAGLRVLDLGCGDAALGRRLLDAGCRSYLGVDASARMAEAARATLRGTAGEVRHQDVRDVVAPEAGVDLVVARLVLHYLPDVTAVLAGCRRWLTPGGRLLVTVPHPVVTAPRAVPSPGRPRTSWLVDDYFLPGRRVRDWMGGTVVWHHRTIEEYVGALLAAGFALTALSECAPRPDLFEGDVEELGRRRRTPLFLLLMGS